MGNLIQCPDCGREVSVRARACPHCGCPFVEVAREPPQRVIVETKERRRTSFAGGCFLLIVIGVVVGSMVGTESGSTKPPKKKASSAPAPNSEPDRETELYWTGRHAVSRVMDRLYGDTPDFPTARKAAYTIKSLGRNRYRVKGGGTFNDKPIIWVSEFIEEGDTITPYYVQVDGRVLLNLQR